ncbi:MAG: branched-chain amino acid ABC transporter permease [Alphaproteobacteria bacterium]|nr:branched-chain amino acid ABC transporter permease [Alphaproteobacteria bacterium]
MLAALVFFASVPLWIRGVGLYEYIGVEIMIWATYALAYNLTLGQTGLPSFGHGAYFGVGAYAFGLAQHGIAENLWLCLLVAVAAAALAGAAVAAFISHRRGIYFAFMTIAFGQVFWFVAVKWHSVTGGEDGLLKIRRLPVDLGVAAFDVSGNEAFYWLVFAAFALVATGLWRLVNSPFGRVLRAIKQNEARASFVGYDVWLYKFTAFTLSAGLSGFAGALFAQAQQSAFPDVMSLHWSGIVVMMVLVGGGLVSFWGPVVGVAVYFVSRDVIGAATTTWMLWFGLMFMALVLFQPEGIAGAWRHWLARARARLAAAGR